LINKYKNLLFTSGVNFGQAQALKRVINRLEGVLSDPKNSEIEALLAELNVLIVGEKEIVTESEQLSIRQRVAAAEITPREKPLLSIRLKQAIIGAIDGWTGGSED
jgi:hypothetical protein